MKHSAEFRFESDTVGIATATVRIHIDGLSMGAHGTDAVRMMFCMLGMLLQRAGEDAEDVLARGKSLQLGFNAGPLEFIGGVAEAVPDE